MATGEASRVYSITLSINIRTKTKKLHRVLWVHEPCMLPSIQVTGKFLIQKVRKQLSRSKVEGQGQMLPKFTLGFTTTHIQETDLTCCVNF